METKNTDVSLSSICNGRAEDVFQHLLDDVMANIRDPNYPATKKRKITIELTFTPTKSREEAAVEVGSKLTLADLEKESSFLFMAHRGDKTIVQRHDVQQGELDEEASTSESGLKAV